MQDGGRPPFLKPLNCHILQPFDRFWWNFARWCILPPYSGAMVKISNFWKSKMAAAAILKITEIAISPQLSDRSLRNLVHWCKLCLLTTTTVKKFEFHKSKMADGCHFKNRYIILSQQPFDWFLLNLARWCMLLRRACRKFQIFDNLIRHIAAI